MTCVSIITPAYNSEKFIDETIRSVLNQNFSDWELIVIDDASKDDTIKKVNKWMTIDQRIRLIVNKKNLGPGPSRNIGIDSSTYRFICFLDSDDKWSSEKLKTQYEFMIGNNVSFTFTAYSLIDDQGKSLHKYIHVPHKIAYSQLLGNTIIGCSTVMIDRNFIPNLQMPDIPSRQPLVLWLNILKSIEFGYGINTILSQYRIRPGSISRNKIKASKQVWNVYREYEKLSLPMSIRYFLEYAVRGYLKNRF